MITYTYAHIYIYVYMYTCKYIIYIYIYIYIQCPAGQPRHRACSLKIESKIMPKSTKMAPKSVHEAL